MNFNLLNRLTSKSLWSGIALYVFSSLLVAAVFCYLIFFLKSYLLAQKLGEINAKIDSFGTAEQKINEKKAFDYKKKIDDFAVIIGKHKISSNMFGFIEKNTLASVWFSSFNMSESEDKIMLSGEAENMETLSSQVKVFESQKSSIKNVDVLNSQIGSNGKIKFVLNLALQPEIFNAPAEALPGGNGL